MYRFTLDDVAFLASPAGAAALRAVDRLPLTDASRVADVTAARALVGDHAAAVLETVALRRRAMSRVDGSAGWLFTEPAAQQATATPVARHRAQRLAGRDVHDVTCSVGADLVTVSRVANRCVGSDLDPVRLAMARHNCAVSGVAPALVRADALRPVTRDTVVLADPARRDDVGRRRWRPEDLVPPLGELADAYAGRDLVVKCGPGLDFATVPWAAEIEVVSLDGQVREATLWTGGLATPGVGRRATVLRSGAEPWTVTDAEPDDCPVRPVGEWLVEPDGAVIRAGLVRHYAARTGLGQLDPRIAYLTGDGPPPGVRAFRVIEESRSGEKRLRALLRRHRIGRLEILVRGLDTKPDELRKRLKPSGDRDGTLVLTRIGDRPTAFLCEAEVIPG